jgi:hypothetical protein
VQPLVPIVTVLGNKEMAERLRQADGGIREVLRHELAMIGEEIVERAQAAAPKATGIMASRISWFFGRERRRGSKGRRYTKIVDEFAPSKHTRKSYRDALRGAIFFTVRPRGTVAHLVERGVNATFYQRPGFRSKWTGAGYREIGPFAGEATQGPEYRYKRTLIIPRRPFFMPAVQAVTGGNVFPRLQARLDELARLS